MGYTKKTWTTGDVITADAMNNLEEGASLQPDYAQTDSTQPDYIKNKLVGKEVTYSDTLTWDGNTDGLESVELPILGITAYKISDSIISLNDLVNGFSVVTPVDGEISLSYDEIVSSGMFNEDGFTFADAFAIVPTDNYTFSDMGVTFPSKGVYATVADGQAMISSLTIQGYSGFPTTTKKRTAEYLEPFEVVTKGGDTLTWDGDTSGKTVVEIPEANGGYVLLTEATPTKDELLNGAVINVISISTGENLQTVTVDDEMAIVTAIPNALVVGGCVVITQMDNIDVDGLIMPKKGTYFMFSGAYDMRAADITIPNYTGFVTTEKKLKGEYVSWDTLGVDYSKETVLVDNKTFAIANGMATIENVFLTEGIYKIVFDGVEYNRQTNNIYGVTLGNLGFASPQLETGEPFAIVDATGAIMILGANGEHTITLIQYAINKIPDFFYNIKTTLYYRSGSGDKYLYKDIGMTTKATLVDLQLAVSKGILELAYEGFIFNTSCRIEITGEYGIVTVFNGLKDGSPTYQTIYTAEYIQ